MSTNDDELQSWRTKPTADRVRAANKPRASTRTRRSPKHTRLWIDRDPRHRTSAQSRRDSAPQHRCLGPHQATAARRRLLAAAVIGRTRHHDPPRLLRLQGLDAHDAARVPHTPNGTAGLPSPGGRMPRVGKPRGIGRHVGIDRGWVDRRCQRVRRRRGSRGCHRAPRMQREPTRRSPLDKGSLHRYRRLLPGDNPAHASP